MKTIVVPLILTGEEAWDLAQFFKRAGLSDYRTNAQDEEEAYRMLYAAEKVRKALAEAGYDPR